MQRFATERNSWDPACGMLRPHCCHSESGSIGLGGLLLLFRHLALLDGDRGFELHDRDTPELVLLVLPNPLVGWIWFITAQVWVPRLRHRYDCRGCHQCGHYENLASCGVSEVPRGGSCRLLRVLCSALSASLSKLRRSVMIGAQARIGEPKATNEKQLLHTSAKPWHAKTNEWAKFINSHT